jgi:hypothetical protein
LALAAEPAETPGRNASAVDAKQLRTVDPKQANYPSRAAISLVGQLYVLAIEESQIFERCSYLAEVTVLAGHDDR